MLVGNNQYHSSIRKVIVAFGTLFSDIQITREDKTGDVQQTIVVPVAYAPKEKWVVRLEQDPDLDGQTYTTLPRISFEITGYNYDPTRKINRMNKINCYKDGADKTSMFSPVPYNIDISLYILTKTQEDAFQILEQILPLFSPEYTLSIRAVPEMNIIQDIPIVLDSVSVSDEYDGDFQTRRFVTHTLTFTLKTNIYGSVVTTPVIEDVTVNMDTNTVPDPSRPELRFNAYVGSSGNINESWEENL